MRDESKSCGQTALHNAGLLLWHTGRGDKARDLADRLCKVAPDSSEYDTVEHCFYSPKNNCYVVFCVHWLA